MHLVEDEELALGADAGRVRDAGRAQVLLGAAGDAARVLRVRLPGDRVRDLADERERRCLRRGIEDRRGRIRHEEHVRALDRLPAADRGPVEAEPLVERGLVERGDGQRHVLPGAEQVAELQVDHRRTRLARPTRAPHARRGVARFHSAGTAAPRSPTCQPPSPGPTKKAPGLHRAPRPHRLGRSRPSTSSSAHRSRTCGRTQDCRLPGALVSWPALLVGRRRASSRSREGVADGKALAPPHPVWRAWPGSRLGRASRLTVSGHGGIVADRMFLARS